MGEINSAQYSSVFPRFLLSLGFHPLGEDAKSCESPWLLVETAFFTPLSVDLGSRQNCKARVLLPSFCRAMSRAISPGCNHSPTRGCSRGKFVVANCHTGTKPCRCWESPPSV